jgi:hypothetical protein
VFVARVVDPAEDFRRPPWMEIGAFGYARERISEWFSRYRWREIRLDDPWRTPIYQLDRVQ